MLFTVVALNYWFKQLGLVSFLLVMLRVVLLETSAVAVDSALSLQVQLMMLGLFSCLLGPRAALVETLPVSLVHQGQV